MKDKVEIVGDWKDHLIRCPSQCELHLKFGQVYFVIYLRWRHSDPWTADLIQTDLLHDINTSEHNWISLDVMNYKEEELESLKEESLNLAKRIIYRREYQYGI